jgi:hypothetical protein
MPQHVHVQGFSPVTDFAQAIAGMNSSIRSPQANRTDVVFDLRHHCLDGVAFRHVKFERQRWLVRMDMVDCSRDPLRCIDIEIGRDDAANAGLRQQPAERLPDAAPATGNDSHLACRIEPVSHSLILYALWSNHRPTIPGRSTRPPRRIGAMLKTH